ncbi:MAG: TolC family protein [Phycisphaerales bacterium]|jgi:outer membrane protein TolC|nr:TolC family protein [Phycisphaerales bacterium]
MNDLVGSIIRFGFMPMLATCMLTGCGSDLFSRDEPWRIPESSLKRIENSDLQTSAEHLSLPPLEAATRVLEGAIEFPVYEQKVALSLADVRASALENNLELSATIIDPAIAEAGYQVESARFESTFVASVSQSDVNQQITNESQSANSSATSVDLGVEIPLQTGGTITFSTPFSRNSQNSQLDFNGLSNFWSAGLQFSISQPLLRDAGLRVNTAPIRVAAYRSQIAQAQAKLAAIRILGNAEKSYWRLYAAWQEFDVRKQQYELAVEQLERAQRLVDLGQTAEIEVIRAESGVGSSLEAIIRADAAIRRTQRELKQVMNRRDLPIESDTALEPSSIPNPVGLVIDGLAMARDAVENRMEVLELDLQLAIDSSDIEVARNATLPDIAVRYDFGLNGNQSGSLANTYKAAFDGFYDTWSVGLSARIPIGNQQAESRLKQTILQRVQRLATRDQRVQAIRLEVFDVVDSINEAWQRILAARLETVLAGRTYEAEKRQFELGLRTSNDVLDASARLADARSREILAVVEYQAALVDAAFATGTIFGSSRIEWLDDDSFAGGRFEEVEE